MAWTDLSSAFTYGSKLTSAQMQGLRDNVSAVPNGDSGAPKITSNAFTNNSIDGVVIQDNSINGAKIYYQSISNDELGLSILLPNNFTSQCVETGAIKDLNVTKGKIPDGELPMTKMEDGMIMLPVCAPEESDELTTSDSGWDDLLTFKVFIPDTAMSIGAFVRVKVNILTFPGHFRISCGGLNSDDNDITNTSYVWTTIPDLDVSSLSSWQNLIIQGNSEDGAGISYLQGYSMIWTS